MNRARHYTSTALLYGLLVALVLGLALLVGCGVAGDTGGTRVVAVPAPTDTPAVVARAPTLPPSRTAMRPAPTVAPTRTPARPSPTRATPSPDVNDRLATIRVAQLPREARETLALIARGGPFPYRQDGVVFQNRERYLPSRPNGYYHEYTVETPGSSDRGARRIITGGGGEMYYTDDHYVTFRRIVQ